MLAHPPPVPAADMFAEPALHWLCRYVYDGNLNFIECTNADTDEALSDTPPRVKRLQVFTLPMSDEDLAFAEQLVDAVLCHNQTQCHVALVPPAIGQSSLSSSSLR